MVQVYVIALTVFVAIGGSMFGYDIGIINGVKDMDGFRREMKIALVSKKTGNDSARCAGQDETENAILGLIVSLFSVGCLIGALSAGALADLLGRKYAVIIGAAEFFVGGAIQTAAFNIWMVFVGRMLAGLGVGGLSMVVPLYIAELAPKNLRGRLVVLNQLLITAGIMVSFIINLIATLVDFGWRVSLGGQCVLGAVLGIGMLFLPETPRWLVKKGRISQAHKVLRKTRKGATDEEIKEEITEIESCLKDTKSYLNMLKIFVNWRVFERVIIGTLVQLLQQLSGINAIMYYSTQIFCSIHIESYVATAIIGTGNFLTTLLTIFLVDKVGRKSLLLTGAICMMMSMLFAGLLIQIFEVDGGGADNKAIGYIIAFLILMFVFGYAYSWGPVSWVVTSEIFPLEIRGLAVGITTSGNWIGNFIVGLVTPLSLGSPLGTPGTFYIFSIILFGAFLFALLTLPETKGESLERIELLFRKPWLQRINLLYYLRFGCPWNCFKRVSNNTDQITMEKKGNEEKSLLMDNDDEDEEPALGKLRK